MKRMLPIGFGLLVKFMFKAEKEHPKEYRETRQDIYWKLTAIIQKW